MTAELDVLRTAYARSLALADGLTPDQLGRPTPCPDWDVRTLLGHMASTADGLVAVLRGEEPDWGRDPIGDGEPAAALRTSFDDAVAAWSAPGAVEVPSRQMPGMRVVDFALGDAVAHAWDLAAALGEPLDLPDDVVRVVHDRWAGAPAETGREYGVFGPLVDVPADAPVLHRLLGQLGRDPSFT